MTLQTNTYSPYDIILSPVSTEKSYNLKDHGKYVFIVKPDANKSEIKKAVQQIFDVHVAKVNTLNRRGKTFRTRFGSGKRKDIKRAIITLKPGQTIDLFQ